MQLSHPWFAVRVKARHEKVVEAALTGKGFPVFLPLYRSKHRSSGRIQAVELPLFGGYVFCSFDPWQRLPILVTPGVFDIVSSGSVLLPVDDRELAAIRTAIAAGLTLHACNRFQIGDRVTIDDGPLRGLEGTVTNFKGRDCLVVTVSLLNRSVAIELDRESVQQVAHAAAASQRALTS